MISIVQIPHPALRKVSVPIPVKDIKGGEIKKLLKDLSVSLNSREDGVGLSAPQLGINKRVFVVSGKVFDADWIKDKASKDKKYVDEYFINPIVIKKSKKLSTAEEGCLSIPNTYGMVKRPLNVTIEYTTEAGAKKRRGAGGLLARIFQHEIDHLDGILFTDKATNIKEIKDAKTDEEL